MVNSNSEDVPQMVSHCSAFRGIFLLPFNVDFNVELLFFYDFKYIINFKYFSHFTDLTPDYISRQQVIFSRIFQDAIQGREITH